MKQDPSHQKEVSSCCGAEIGEQANPNLPMGKVCKKCLKPSRPASPEICGALIHVGFEGSTTCANEKPCKLHNEDGSWKQIIHSNQKEVSSCCGAEYISPKNLNVDHTFCSKCGRPKTGLSSWDGKKRYKIPEVDCSHRNTHTISTKDLKAGEMVKGKTYIRCDDCGGLMVDLDSSPSKPSPDTPAWEKEFDKYCKEHMPSAFHYPRPKTGTSYKEDLKKFISSIEQRAREETDKKWAEKTIIIPKGSTHPVHDICENCFSRARQEVGKQIIEMIKSQMVKVEKEYPYVGDFRTAKIAALKKTINLIVTLLQSKRDSIPETLEEKK